MIKKIKFKKTFFIADIAANHDGSLIRAKKLIRLCAKAGADAAKFQHFKAETIVSDIGFKELGKITHQSAWKKTVFQTYEDASIDNSWTKTLSRECRKSGILFMTSPYDLDYVDSVDKYVDAYKIGSGDIDWIKIIKKISNKNKHVMLATGASKLLEVKNAVNAILKYNKKKIVLMQCNTNYTNSHDNFNYINLKVLLNYKKLFKNKIILGLSDHTPGHITVLGAVALGAKVIEKHFTDDNNRSGPDHKFSMNFHTWKSMVEETRLLEKSLGDGNKKIEKNEIDSAKVQKRSCYAKKIISKGKKITEDMIIPLRPVLEGSFKVSEINLLIDKKAKRKINQGECIKKKLVQ